MSHFSVPVCKTERMLTENYKCGNKGPSRAMLSKAVEVHLRAAHGLRLRGKRPEIRPKMVLTGQPLGLSDGQPEPGPLGTAHYEPHGGTQRHAHAAHADANRDTHQARHHVVAHVRAKRQPDYTQARAYSPPVSSCSATETLLPI